ncbi:MAG: metal ABC transporter substrate-binding protein [Bacillota bacterium]
MAVLKKIRFFILIMFILAVISGCAAGDRKTAVAAGGGKDPGPSSGTGEKVRVTATIFPLYDFARNIGGDRVEVYSLLPPGAEPHHWEPAPGDLVMLGKSKVLLYNGAGLESWLESALKNVDRSKMTVVDCSAGVTLIGGREHDGDGGDQKEDHKEEHKGGEMSDPHIWLDPANAAVMVDNILSGMVKADPANSDYYTENAGKYKARLADLDGKYRSALAGAAIKHFVVSHDSFGYLARRYGLEQVPIRGLNADSEPGPARMAEIVDLVRKYRIKYIFYETLVSPRVSEAIARETGARTLVLNDVAGLTEKEISQGKNYLSVMEENLQNLKTACEAR